MTTPASPRPAASWVDRHARWPVLGGVIMGAAHLHPTLAPLAWIGLGVFAWGLSRLEGRVNRALAIFGGLWASVFLSQIWLCLTITQYMGPLVGSDEAPSG